MIYKFGKSLLVKEKIDPTMSSMRLDKIIKLEVGMKNFIKDANVTLDVIYLSNVNELRIILKSNYPIEEIHEDNYLPHYLYICF